MARWRIVPSPLARGGPAESSVTGWVTWPRDRAYCCTSLLHGSKRPAPDPETGL